MIEILIGLFILLLGWGGIALYFRWTGRGAEARRMLQRTSRVPFEALQDGKPGKVTGALVYVSDPLRAPLTGRSCAAWEVEVEELTADRETIAPVWQPIIVEQDAKDFLVDDGHGRILVKSELIRVSAVKDARFWSGPARDAAPELDRYLREHGESSRNALGFNRMIRYREGILEAGELVTVLGVPRMVVDRAEPTSYRVHETRAVMLGLEDGFVVVSDDPDVAK